MKKIRKYGGNKMKQFLKIFLAIALVLSFLIVSEKAFAQDDSYVLHEDGGSVKYATDDAESLVDYMKNFWPADSKSYTLELYKDLEIPLDGTNLKTLILCSDLTLNGNGNKITGVPGATKGENTLIRVLGKISGNSTIKNLTIDGEKTYQCIYIDYARSAMVENVKILNGYVKKVREISEGAGIFVSASSTLIP